MEAPVTSSDSDEEGEGSHLSTWMAPTFATNPQPFYRQFREQAVLRMEGGLAMLTRREDIDFAFRHPEVFSSKMDAALLGNARPLIPLQIDPPEHVKYRRLLDPLFAPRLMAALEEDTAALVNDLIDRFAERGECDFS